MCRNCSRSQEHFLLGYFPGSKLRKREMCHIVNHTLYSISEIDRDTVLNKKCVVWISGDGSEAFGTGEQTPINLPRLLQQHGLPHNWM